MTCRWDLSTILDGKVINGKDVQLPAPGVL